MTIERPIILGYDNNALQLYNARKSAGAAPVNGLSDLFIKLDDEDRIGHMQVIGRTRTGKSSLLKYLMAQDAHAGRGFALFDPHGDLALDILDQIPAERVQQTVYLNINDTEHPIGINLLDVDSPAQVPLIAGAVVDAFQAAFPNSWGDRMDYIFYRAVAALCEAPGTSLLSLPRFLTDQAYRNQILKHVSDPLIVSYWQVEFAAFDKRQRAEFTSPILNKVGKALATPALRNILGQPKSTISPRLIMDRGDILIVDLSPVAVSEAHANLMGALLMAKLYATARERGAMPPDERRPFYLYADEFQNFASTTVAKGLAQAAKFGLSYVLSHQHLQQVDEPTQQSVLTNVANRICFRLGHQDAEILGRNLDTYTQELLPALPRYRALALLDDADGDVQIELATVPPNDRRFTGMRQSIINDTRTRFAKSRQSVEARINRFLKAQEMPTYQAPRAKRYNTAKP